MLVLLMHIIGDVHQPLHASIYYSPFFINGDRGGNDFKIKAKNIKGEWEETNIHKYIDNLLHKIHPIKKVFHFNIAS